MEQPSNFPKPFYRWRPHPWHGLETGPNPPEKVHAFIEITPFDFVKYEVDKVTGYIFVDRPQRTSSLPPALYGFIPRTYCGEHVKALSEGALQGDGDPLDICVISERPINRAEIILDVVVVGVIQLLDHDEADDKIIAILSKDNIYGKYKDIEELPPAIIERLTHYFHTYKMLPGEEQQIKILNVGGHEKAQKIVEAAMLDYQENFGS